MPSRPSRRRFARARTSPATLPVELGDERATIPLQPTPGTVYITLLTSMFMHGSLMHLLGNMLFLWIFGDNVEDDLSHGRYFAFYLVTGLIASLSHVVSTFVLGDNPFIPSLGASGAISGVMGGYLVLHPHRRVRVIMFRMLTDRAGLRGGRSLVRVSADQRLRRDWTGSGGGRRRRVHGAYRRVRRRCRPREAVCRREPAADATHRGLVTPAGYLEAFGRGHDTAFAVAQEANRLCAADVDPQDVHGREF